MDKIKKFTVPKAFLRNHNAQENGYALEDNLGVDTPILYHRQIIEESYKIDTIDTIDTGKKSTKTLDATVVKRKPTAYNIFVKETLEILKKTHTHLTAKEKFHTAILMWNESKIK
jgi:hypothetical protein